MKMIMCCHVPWTVEKYLANWTTIRLFSQYRFKQRFQHFAERISDRTLNFMWVYSVKEEAESYNVRDATRASNARQTLMRVAIPSGGMAYLWNDRHMHYIRHCTSKIWVPRICFFWFILRVEATWQKNNQREGIRNLTLGVGNFSVPKD
jgi:hypothetical protein